jgi:uncharacterized protein DUF4291
VTQASDGRSRLRIWLDTWGEPFSAREELRWLLGAGGLGMTVPNPSSLPSHQIRAVYDDKVITVYQAYPARIAAPTLEAGTFTDPFRRSRMTWITEPLSQTSSMLPA